MRNFLFFLFVAFPLVLQAAQRNCAQKYAEANETSSGIDNSTLENFTTLKKPLLLKKGKKVLELGWMISEPNEFGMGGSSSYVYLTVDKKHIVKFYNKQIGKIEGRAMTFYEFWITKYLRSKGLDFVLPVEDYLENVRFKGMSGYAIVRPYVKSLGFYPYGKEIPKKLKTQLNAKFKQVKEQFDPKKFVKYIKANSDIQNPEEILDKFRNQYGVLLWREGDYQRRTNWIYTNEGWV